MALSYNPSKFLNIFSLFNKIWWKISHVNTLGNVLLRKISRVYVAHSTIDHVSHGQDMKILVLVDTITESVFRNNTDTKLFYAILNKIGKKIASRTSSNRVWCLLNLFYAFSIVIFTECEETRIKNQSTSSKKNINIVNKENFEKKRICENEEKKKCERSDNLQSIICNYIHFRTKYSILS